MALVSLEVASAVVLLAGVPPFVDFAGGSGITITISTVLITITIAITIAVTTILAIVSVADEDDCVIKP